MRHDHFSVAALGLIALAVSPLARAQTTPPAKNAQTPSAAATAAAANANAKKQLQQYVQDALNQALLAIKATPKQKKIFSEEATGDAQSFVTNYKTSGVGSDLHTDVQVDSDKLAQYLRFDGALFAGSAAGMVPRVCVRVRPERNCGPCQRLAPVLEALVSDRLARRGFAPAPGPQTAVESELSGESAFEDYLARATEARCDAALYGEVETQRSADADDDDEDLRLSWTEFLSLRDRAGRKIKVKVQGAVAASKADLDAAGTRGEAQLLSSRATADLYAQAATQASSEATGGALGMDVEEHYLRLSGVTSFAVYTKFKELAGAALPGVKLEERLIKPGEFSFVIPETLSIESLMATLKGVNWGGQVIQIVSATTTDLEVALK